jgi:hypothetical protein
MKKNMAILPTYSVMLAFLHVARVMALTAHLKPVGGSLGKPDANTVDPGFFNNMLPD